MRPLNSLENTLIYIVLAVAIAGILYAGFLVRQILAESKGSAKMQQVWGYIRTGANAYLSSQFRIIAVLIVVLCVVLFFSVYVVNPTPYAIEHFCPDVATAARASVDDVRQGRLVLVADRTLKVLCGASAIGPAAESLIGVAVLAIQARVSLDVLNEVIAPFPSWGEAYAPLVRSLLSKCARKT